MAPRLNIDQITTDTPDWTSKVQIVDISRERESPEKKIRFQNLILEDEEEQQIRVVVYGEDIGHYSKKLQISETYLISAARVRVSSTSYGKPIHKFYWVLDKETVVEHVKPIDDHEKPLLPSTKLNITTFDNIVHITPHSSVEIGLSLQTRFNSTIHINPAYPQALELINWAKTNKHMLSSYASSSFSAASSSLIITPTQQQVIPIAEISSQTSIGVFHVEAQMFISNDLQKFCVLECSGCKQKKRTKERREFECTKCNRQTTLVPRCTFQIDLIDASGSITAFISGDIAEKMLSMTAEHI